MGAPVTGAVSTAGEIARALGIPLSRTDGIVRELERRRPAPWDLELVRKVAWRRRNDREKQARSRHEAGEPPRGTPAWVEWIKAKKRATRARGEGSRGAVAEDEEGQRS